MNARILLLFGILLSGLAQAQGKYIVKPLVEMKVSRLPDGPLYWRIERFPTLAEAKAASGAARWNPDTVAYDETPSLVAEAAGKAWRFTLGPKGSTTPGASKVAEVGPVPAIQASEYLLRVNLGSGPPGSKTSMHSHPGSEAFYVVAGRLGQRTPRGLHQAEAGQTLNGHPADTPMEVFNAGAAEVTALIMFVVDAGRPFSTPAKLPPD